MGAPQPIRAVQLEVVVLHVVLGDDDPALSADVLAVHGRMECAGLLVKGNERVFPPGEGIDFLGYVTFGCLLYTSV